MYKILISLGLLVLASCGSYDPSTEASSDADPATVAPSVNLVAAHIDHDGTVVAKEVSTDSFTMNVDYEFYDVTFYFKTEDPSAKIIFNDDTLSPGDHSSVVSLNPGDNQYNVIVSAGGNAKTYVMTVHRGNNNADLLSLTNDQGDLDPSFDSDLTTYSLNTVEDNLHIVLTVDDGASVENKLYDDNGTEILAETNADLDHNYDLTTDGHYQLKMTVTSSDETTTKTYTINIAKLKNTGLTNILIEEAYSLSPDFDNERAVYTVNVPYSVSSIHIAGVKADDTATLGLSLGGTNYTDVASNVYKTFTLAVGANAINLDISKGAESSTYKVYVVRGDSEARLDTLNIDSGVMSPNFDSDIYSYVIRVDYSDTVISFTPTTLGDGATISNGTSTVSSGSVLNSNLNLGSNTVTLTVTSADETSTKKYNFTVIRGNNDTDLSSLVLSSTSISPSFNSDTVVYTAQTTASSLTVTPTANDSNSTITVNGTTVLSGVESSSISLSAGTNTISVVVISSDTLNQKTYTIYIERD